MMMSILMYMVKGLLFLFFASLASFAFFIGIGIARHFQVNKAFEYPELIQVEKRGKL